jgi:hypothetical protein
MAATPERVSGHDRPKPAKPDPRPMRVALGAGGLAAMSAIVAAIVAPPRPDAVVLPAPAVAADPNGQVVSDPGAIPTPAQVQRQIQYVQLQPGQTAPPGATVIPATAPTPITVVVSVPGGGGGGGGGNTTAAKPAPKPTPIIIKTTQSGKVIP